MSHAATHTGEAPSAVERLLEDSWEARDRRASRRELAVDAATGALFLAFAAGLQLASGGGAPPFAVAGLLVVLYAMVARIEFPVGAGHVLPTQLVLVPMLVVLPPATVPLLVAAGLVAASAIDWLCGRTPARRIASAVPDAWHAVGPALVLVLAGSPARRTSASTSCR